MTNTFTETAKVSLREVVYLITIAIAIGIQWASNKYNIDVIRQEMQRSTEITSIYVEQLQQSNSIQDKRLEAVELGLRKMELELAEKLSQL